MKSDNEKALIIENLSIDELRQLIIEQKISILQVIKRYYERIDQYNYDINAIIYQRKREIVLREAKELDTKIKTMLDENKFPEEILKEYPLLGAPFCVKDIFETKGEPMTAGSLGLDPKKNIGKKDATIVTRLKQAGAIFIGKTNTPEFENAADTYNSRYGITHNPHDLNYSAGGSSGGCAAAVAAKFCLFSIGADHGGSLRIPAHYNGVTTIRCTPGTIPSTGVYGDMRKGLGARFNTEGPITRYVGDLDLIIKVIKGPDYIDPNTLPRHWPNMKKVNIADLKVAYFFNDMNCNPNEEVKQAVKNAADAIQKAGGQVEEKMPEGLEKGYNLYKDISGPIATYGFNGLFKKMNLSEDQRSILIKKQLENFSPHNTDEATKILEDNEKLDEYRSKILSFFWTHHAFICPVTATEALPSNHPMWFGKEHYLSFCWVVSAAKDLPAATVKAGSTNTSSPLPIGVQIVTAPHREDIALALAKKIEEELGGYVTPKFTP